MGHHGQDWVLRQQARYRYRRALDQVRKGNLGVAMEALSLALDHHPHPATVHNTWGRTCWQAGDTAGALAHFTQATLQDPGYGAAYSNRGLLYYKTGDSVRALEDWHTALQCQPHNALIHYNRGLLYEQQHNLEAALADLNQAIQYDPNLAEAYFHRGNLKDRLGDRPGAIRDWELALCNDLNLTQARQKLLLAQQHNRDSHLADKLRVALNLNSLRITARIQADQLHITVERPKGLGINYFTLPNDIRLQLVSWDLPGVRTFRLVGKVADQTLLEWQQVYNLYQGQPCPPAHWFAACLTTLLIFPPLGIPALVYAFNLRRAYRRGDYQTAQQASNTIKALCRLGGLITGTVLAMVLGYELSHGVGTLLKSRSIAPQSRLMTSPSEAGENRLGVAAEFRYRSHGPSHHGFLPVRK